ncbi:MAG: hypothetical protein R2873_09780 [Caldilineaceae bacterium]
MSQTSFDHETYLSPLTWRYGSAEMRRVWSEAEKRRLLRRFWVALAEAQHAAGLVTAEQVADLRTHQGRSTSPAPPRSSGRSATISWPRSRPSPSSAPWVGRSSTWARRRWTSSTTWTHCAYAPPSIC